MHGSLARLPNGDNVEVDSNFLRWTDRNADLLDSFKNNSPYNLTYFKVEGNHILCQIKIKVLSLECGGTHSCPCQFAYKHAHERILDGIDGMPCFVVNHILTWDLGLEIHK